MAAEQVFGEKGFQSATIEDLAARAELSVGTLYLYFKSKEELFISLIFEAMSVFHGGLLKIRRSSRPPAAKLREVWAFFIRFREEHPMYYKALLHLHDADFTRSLSPPVREAILQRSGENFDLGGLIVSEGAPDGRPRSFIELLWAAFMGLVYIQDTRRNLSRAYDPRKDRAFFRRAYGVLELGLARAGGGL